MGSLNTLTLGREIELYLKARHKPEAPDQGEGGDAESGPEDSKDTAGQMPSTMELLGVITTGMRQLQDVQLRQWEKKSDAPEVGEAGNISTTGALSSRGQDTSPVDIQDWLEEAGSVMTDLSDSSWEWWLQIKTLAEEHYREMGSSPRRWRRFRWRCRKARLWNKDATVG